MPVKTKRELHVRWDTTARRWLERNAMPNGTSLVLERMKDGRRVRADSIIHRRTLPGAARNDDAVSDALEALEKVFITDIKARRQYLRLYAPDGALVRGNTLVGTVRALPGVATEEDETQAEYVELEVEMISSSLLDDLDLAEDTASSADIVLRGYVRALCGKFSSRQILAAVETERK